MGIPLSSQRNHSKKVIVPRSVARDASLGILMLKRGFAGGTPTGWNRAKQLAHDGYVDIKTLATMRAWFARHGPDARTGGTSYPGYCAWLKDGKPLDRVAHLKPFFCSGKKELSDGIPHGR